MFHIQLRQFPHNYCQFNLSDEDMRSLAELWASGDWLVVGERKWSPQQAKLTVIEAPRMDMAQLSMGRGWRLVERRGADVTRQVLADAGSSRARPQTTPRPVLAAGAPASASAQAGAGVEAASEHAHAGRRPPEGELPSLLGGGARGEALLSAWRETSARFPARSPSETLALAEEQLASSRAQKPS